MHQHDQRLILLVEDELLIATVKCSALEARGYRTLHASTGEEAVTMVAEGVGPIDLILMDIDLGKGIDGTEAARRILEKRELPIVFISAHEEPAYLQRIAGITSYGYIPKAANEDILCAAVGMALSLHLANRAQAESAQRFDALKSTVLDAFLMADDHGRILDVNEATSAMTGYSRAELLNMNVADLDAHEGPEYFEHHFLRLRRVGHHRFERTLRKADGTTIEIAARVTFVPGQDAVVGFLTDITEQRHRQQMSEDAAALYHAMFTNTEAVKLLIDPETATIVDANAAAAAFYGYPLDRLKGLAVDRVNTLSRERILDEMASARQHKRNFFRFKHRHASGTLRDVEVYSTPIELGGRAYLNSIVFDVTERDQAKEMVERERGRLASIIEGTNAGTWEWNVQTGATVFNERWAEMIGYTREELMPMTIDTWSRLAHPDDLLCSQRALDAHFRGESPYYECEVRMRHKEGRWVWVLDRGRVREWSAVGQPLMMYGTHQDITARKEAEQAVEDALAYNRSLIQSLPVGVLTLRADGDPVTVNGAAAAILGTSVRELEHTNFRTSEHWARTGLFRAGEEALASGEARSLEFRGDPGYGKEVWLTTRFVPLERGTEKRLMVVLVDIGEPRRAELQIRELLREKDLLLREVHHRVKNNMNTMRSILALQASAIEDGPAREVLQESERRLLSMMLLYEKLYKSTVMGVVRVDDYLGSLLRDIVANTREGTPVALTTALEPFGLPARQMSALGIIINELVSNVMKYAFAGRTRGALHVSAIRRGDRITVTVADDGVGLPAGFEARTSGGFGLQLVQLLTEQLGGAMQVRTAKGTTWTLEFTGEDIVAPEQPGP